MTVEASSRHVHLIETAKLNAIAPEAYLHAGIAHIAQHPMRKRHELFPWNIKL
jgi:hypothetical protein